MDFTLLYIVFSRWVGFMLENLLTSPQNIVKCAECETPMKLNKGTAVRTYSDLSCDTGACVCDAGNLFMRHNKMEMICVYIRSTLEKAS